MRIDLELFGYWISVRHVDECNFPRAFGKVGLRFLGHSFYIGRIWK